MREIIQVSGGRCGIFVGSKFWETVSEEHSIDVGGIYKGETDKKLERLNVYYNETVKGHYVPRTIFMDLEPGPQDATRASKYGSLYRPQNFISGKTSGGNNWAIGHYTDGAELIDRIIDQLRREAEICDRLQGFQISHSLGGGTGSGLGSLLL